MFFEEPYYVIPDIMLNEKERVEKELLAVAVAEGIRTPENGMRLYPVTRRVRNWRYVEEFGKTKNPQPYIEEDTGAWSLDFRADKLLSNAAISALWSKGIRIKKYVY